MKCAWLWCGSFTKHTITGGKLYINSSYSLGPKRTWHIKVKARTLLSKQIARQLRTQFIEGISVTLKSTLRVTQGHWKWNHWVDHARLTISRIIWHWILLWPWNVGQRSLKVIENGTIWKIGYGFLFACRSNYGRIFSHFGDIQRQRTIWPWNLRLGSFKVIENSTVW